MAIPKIVHYCWFGEKEKPDSVKKCIESWKRYLPDYQLMEWNEDNFDIENCNIQEKHIQQQSMRLSVTLQELKHCINMAGFIWILMWKY